MSGQDAEREQALTDFKNKLLESREWEAKLKVGGGSGEAAAMMYIDRSATGTPTRDQGPTT